MIGWWLVVGEFGDVRLSKRNYKDLLVWRRAIDLVPVVYGVVNLLPREENYALGDQLRRAAVSIAANIAEGQARRHPKEFLQYLAIAKGSLAELHTLLVIAERLGYLASESLHNLEEALAGVSRPLHNLSEAIAHPPTTNYQPKTAPKVAKS